MITCTIKLSVINLRANMLRCWWLWICKYRLIWAKIKRITSFHEWLSVFWASIERICWMFVAPQIHRWNTLTCTRTNTSTRGHKQRKTTTHNEMNFFLVLKFPNNDSFWLMLINVLSSTRCNGKKGDHHKSHSLHTMREIVSHNVYRNLKMITCVCSVCRLKNPCD